MNPDEEKAACEAPEEVSTWKTPVLARNAWSNFLQIHFLLVTLSESHAQCSNIAQPFLIRLAHFRGAPGSPCYACNNLLPHIGLYYEQLLN